MPEALPKTQHRPLLGLSKNVVLNMEAVGSDSRRLYCNVHSRMREQQISQDENGKVSYPNNRLVLPASLENRRLAFRYTGKFISWTLWD